VLQKERERERERQGKAEGREIKAFFVVQCKPFKNIKIREKCKNRNMQLKNSLIVYSSKASETSVIELAETFFPTS